MPTSSRTSLWLSHSSIGDYLKCPRSYYLKNMHKDPQTRRKVAVVQPALSLGQAVHTVLESLQNLPVAVRFNDSLPDKYETAWASVSGLRGGFSDAAEEAGYKERGLEMIKRVVSHPGPLANKAVAIPARSMMIDGLPSYFLSEEEDIILCGKIDWMEYLPETDSVHILDFKTGKNEEKAGSLQLPIYRLLVKNCQNREATKASYWYLETDDAPSEVALPDLNLAHRQVLDIALSVKLARKEGMLDCLRGGCFACQPFEEIIGGRAEYIGFDSAMNKDLYRVDS